MNTEVSPTDVIRSCWVWGASFSWMAGAWAATTALGPIIPWQRSHKWLMKPAIVRCLDATGSDVEILQHPNFDPERRSVFCQNHVNLMDAHAACTAIPHAFCGLMNWWHFKVPVYGWLMTMGHGIPVPPKRPGRFREIAAAARLRADEGLSILVFPEAHRTLDGRVRPFRSGVFRMARDAGLPVVPLAARGMFEMMHKGSLVVRPTKISLLLGPQLETAGLSDEALDRLAEDVRQMIVAFVEKGEVHESIDSPNQKDKRDW